MSLKINFLFERSYKIFMCQKYVFKKAYYNSKLIHMQELDEFCNQYLPLYFALKYKDGNIKEPYFNFKS